MLPLEFLFTLLEKYVPVSPGRFLALKAEGDKWYNSAEVEKNKIGNWVKTNGNKWWVQLIFACLYIFAMRWIHDFMNPKAEDSLPEGKI